MSDVPPEIITDILSRLPVKSLLRFRCVSKSLKATIDNPYFIKTHLLRQQTLKPNPHIKLVLNNGSFLSIDFNSVGTSSQPQQLDDPLKKLSSAQTFIRGSCHGLVLISNTNYLLCLWNPSTKVFRKLPACDLKKPQGKEKGEFRVSRGFGYDSSSDDYKVVQIAQWFFKDDRCNISRIMIFSLKSDSWRKVEECEHWVISYNGGELAGGVLHWIASNYYLPMPNCFVIGLNLATEKIQLVPFPENLGVLWRLAVLGDCLCLLDTSENDHVLYNMDIWVMKDYGVKESWTKLFSVGQRDGLQLGIFESKPIAYSENGREVLLQTDAKRFFWYSLETSSLANAMVCDELDDFASLYLETLVPPHGCSNGKNKEKSVDQDKRGNRRARERDDFLSKGFNLRL